MGNNNVACFYRHSGSLPFPCHLQLGRDATINLTTSVFHKGDDGSYADKGEVSYTVEGSKCNIMLTRLVYSGDCNLVTFILHDNIICLDRENLFLQINKTGTGFLGTIDFKTNNPIPWTKTKKNLHAWGGVTDTKVYLYGTANRCGLLVWECKKNDYLQQAKAVTMAHYFVNSNGIGAVNTSSETTDVGFSVVVKVGVSDGKFDITVEGPEQHPVSALLYMFDEVKRSGIWKPSMCPHCSNIWRKQSRMFWQSDSEDSDGVPLPPHHGSQKNAATNANDGRFKGHANGSFIRCKNFYGFN
ncbi:hypothetical protein VNO80_12370 [Phaseolus coccineus]|uniref:Uncharacterized protein n=1 Tax=Phaseolus coccineus TaxID=3886 RepID=A0AAN9N0G6_PHACN